MRITMLIIGLLITMTAAAQTILRTNTGDAAGDHFAGSRESVREIGDLNGDGFNEYAIGANQNGVDEGYVRVFDGASGSIRWTVRGTDMAIGAFTNSNFGSTVAPVGDINGNGFVDLLVGAPADDMGGTKAGRAWVLDGDMGAVIRSHTGNGVGENLGRALDGIGDLDGDGTPEYAIGAPHLTASGIGYVTIYDGHSGTALTGSLGTTPTFVGNAANDGFGVVVAGLGDVNADGVPDLAVGAHLASGTGEVWIFSGQSRTSLGGSPIVGGNSGDSFGVDLDVIGDINGDGRPELAIGAPLTDFNGSNSGSVYVYDLGAMPSCFYRIDGANQYGNAVAGAGDVDGDAVDDFLVNQGGAPQVTFVVSSAKGTTIADFPYTGGASGLGDFTGEGNAEIGVGDPTGNGQVYVIDLRISAAVTCAGTGGDFRMRVGVNRPPRLHPLSYACTGSGVSMALDSPLGTLDFEPVAIAAAIFPTGAAPVAAAPPLVCLPLPGSIVIYGLPIPSGLDPVILPGGTTTGFVVPRGLAGFSILLQGFTLSPLANNGFFESSQGFEIRL